LWRLRNFDTEHTGPVARQAIAGTPEGGDAPKRSEVARRLVRRLDVEIKEIDLRTGRMTSSSSPKRRSAITSVRSRSPSMGNVRTSTSHA
jgi:hypothetical protein